ncbi:MAG: hypothetical protein WC817_01285 [Patescibacteria group bacterium]|jgi:hypothetical protein
MYGQHLLGRLSAEDYRLVAGRVEGWLETAPRHENERGWLVGALGNIDVADRALGLAVQRAEEAICMEEFVNYLRGCAGSCKSRSVAPGSAELGRILLSKGEEGPNLLEELARLLEEVQFEKVAAAMAAIRMAIIGSIAMEGVR